MTERPDGVPRLSWTEVCARRLERHLLADPSPDAGPADIVAATCGVHAQVMTAAEWSIGLRLADATSDVIRNALWVERSLVKTFGPRGTVHLLPARDLPVWTGALSAIPPVRMSFPEDARLTPEQTETVVEAIGAALDGVELTVDELSEAVVARAGAWAGDLVMPAFQGFWPRWRQAVSTAAHRGALCFGPNRGRKVTYTNPRNWLPGFQQADGQTALQALVRAYLRAYGPATPRHLAQWLNAPRRRVADVFDGLASDLEEVEVEGVRAWVVAGETEQPATPPRGVRLLPYFDAYVVGSQPRDLLFPGRAAERALAGGQAGNFPVLLVDGVVTGVWHQRRAGRTLDVTVEPFVDLPTLQRRELDDQVERLGAFFDAKPWLTIGTVTVGAHA